MTIVSVDAPGRWLFLAGVFMMITGDSPEGALRALRWDVHAPALAWPWLYLVLLAAGLAVMALGGRPPIGRVRRAACLAWPVAMLLAAFLLSTILSRAPLLSLPAWLLATGIVTFGWSATRLLEDEALLDGVVTTMAVAIVLLAVRVVDWRLDAGLDAVSNQVLNNAWEGKLQLAWVFTLCAPLLLARCVDATDRRRALLYGLAWAGAAASTVLLYSRMAVLVLAVTTACQGLLSRAYWKQWAALVAGGVLVGLVIAGGRLDVGAFAPAALLDAERNPGIAIRLGAFRDALRIFAADPVTGAGLGTFDEVVYALPDPSADDADRRNGWHAHNTVLHVLAETGVVGLLAWCLFWCVLLAALARAWTRADARGRVRAIAALATVTSFLLLSLTEVLVGARVHASLRMNLTIALLVAVAIRFALPAPGDSPSSEP
jgi:O-antigen ligase